MSVFTQFIDYQLSDSDLTAIANLSTTGIIERTGTGTAATITKPAGSLVGTTDTQTLTNKTITAPRLTEGVFTITDSSSVVLNPNNGTIQLWTLGASRTPAASFESGQSMLLMVNDGNAFTINWGAANIVWVGGFAPILATTGFTLIELWRVVNTIYGVRVGVVQ